MAEYKCGNCRETLPLSPKARFCPECGSSSLILVVREQAEPHQKETVGVYQTATMAPRFGTVEVPTEPPVDKEEEDQPRKPRRR